MVGEVALVGGGDGAVHLGAPGRVGEHAEQIPQLGGRQRRVLVLASGTTAVFELFFFCYLCYVSLNIFAVIQRQLIMRFTSISVLLKHYNARRL